MLRFALLLLLAGPAARAASDAAALAKIPKFEASVSTADAAVVIGIENYREVGASKHSAKDAQLFYDYLIALGYAPRNVNLLINERATKSDLEFALETWLPNHAVPGGRVVVYYSGHGAPDPETGEAYLVPANARPAYLKNTGYAMKRLHGNLASLKDSKVVLLVDACFSGTGGRSVMAPGARPLVNLVSPVLRRGDNVTIMTASQDSQISTSSPERGHGLFTYHLIEALRAGKSAVDDIYEFVRPKVEDDARRQNVSQSPTLVKAAAPFTIADIKSVVFDAPKKPAVSPEALAELEAEKERLAEEKKRMAEEKKRLAEDVKKKEKALKEERRRMERELKEKERADRKRMERERKAKEEELRRKERELKRRSRKKRNYRAPPPP
jgi:uncharacterized caspase-like protein